MMLLRIKTFVGVKRYYVSGFVWHISHRGNLQEFLLRFAKKG